MKVLRLIFTVVLIASSLIAEVNSERFPPPTTRQKASSYTTIGYYIGVELKDLVGRCSSFSKYRKSGAEENFHAHSLNPLEITEEQAQMPAIILLHGAGSNQGLWVPLANAIEKSEAKLGPVYSFNFEQETGIACLTKKIESIRAQYLAKGAEHVELHLVGHSLGAIVSAEYAFDSAKWVEGTTVKKVISITGRLKNLEPPAETPYYPFCCDVLPLINQIWEHILVSTGDVELFTLVAVDDWLVPEESVLIADEDHQARIAGRGHLGIIFHEEAHAQVIEWLAR